MLNVGLESWRSRLAWFLAALAPWTLGLVLMMTFAAEAGQEPGNLSALAAHHDFTRATLAAVGPGFDTGDFMNNAYGGMASRQPLILASLDTAQPSFSALEAPAGSSQPELVYKSWATGKAASQIIWPHQNAGDRADALIRLRPAVAATTRQIQNSAGKVVASMLAQNGATPKVPRSEVLASATPVELDAVPTPVTAAELAPAVAQTTEVAKGGPQNHGRPDFAALIQPQQARAQEHCLAQAIYFEARSESAQGEAAVAQVVLNRVRSGLYPHTVCGVVFQNYRHHNACQFSFACNGHRLVVHEAAAWQRAVAIAHAVTNGLTYVAKVGDATHYHANYVHPRWAHSMRRMDVIGHHIFYESKPGRS
ncbi:MAG: cell wall hydrolase [Hyphomicrobiales bacterium]|nr:cell wall hydrolase [Hyphomicrobiales bacterium]